MVNCETEKLGLVLGARQGFTKILPIILHFTCFLSIFYRNFPGFEDYNVYTRACIINRSSLLYRILEIKIKKILSQIPETHSQYRELTGSGIWENPLHQYVISQISSQNCKFLGNFWDVRDD